MKSILKRTLFVMVTLFAFLFIYCNSNTSKERKQKGSKNIAHGKKNEYDLADQFILKLKNERVDTIIFYKRTCINCCNFFNIFWASKGNRFLNKFYFDFRDMQSHSVSIDLTNDKIFAELKRNYNELKQTSIKDNSHRQKDGTWTIGMIDHYCYAELNIYTEQDSIVTNRIKDHGFDKYTGFGSNYEGETNDNYLENINSKWNTFLTIIENELANMKETPGRELEMLRTR